jgi:membrane protein YdbS with pleckstrin-like domain
MAFPRRLLTAGERVVVELRPHWSALGWSIPAVGATVALSIGVTVAWQSAPVAVGEALLALVGVSALWLGTRLLRWSRTWLVVTNTRLVQRSGVVAHRGVELRLTRVNEISYDQSILGRLFGVGRLYVEVGGERGMCCFAHVRHPAAVAGVLHEQIASLGTGGSPAVPGPDTRQLDDLPGRRRWRGEDNTPPTGTVLEGQSRLSRRLLELDDLRRRGLLTEEEFAEQKARLLRD